MGFTFDCVLVHKRLEKEALIHAMKSILVEKELGIIVKRTAKEKISREGMSIGGSKIAYISPYHRNYGFRKIGIYVVGDEEINLLNNSELAMGLSRYFNDEPIMRLSFHSSCDAGAYEIYKNGELEDSGADSEECGNLKCADEAFKSIFGGSRVLQIMKNFFEFTEARNGFGVASYPYLEFMVKENPEDEYFTKPYLQLQEFKKNPKMTDEELEKCIESGYPAMWVNMYKKTLYIKRKKNKTKMYLLTDGFICSKGGSKYLNDPIELTYEKYFELRNQFRQEFEAFKERKYGERPKSYSLSNEELSSLSYDEQKKRAFKLYETAKERGDKQGVGSYIYTKGIKIQTSYKEGAKIKVEDRVYKVEAVWLTESVNDRTYVERHRAIEVTESDTRRVIVFNTDEIEIELLS